MKRARRICSERDILLIADEIITGFGRTGHWFAVDHYGIRPDIMVLAKGIAGGLPVSAVVGRREAMDSWPPGSHSSTFLGNPVGCAACLAAIAEIERRDLVAASRRKGELMRAVLAAVQESHPLVGEVRGLGTMVGVELVTDREAKTPAVSETAAVVALAQSRGVNVSQGGRFGNVLKMSPPFVITDAQVKTALRILADCIGEVESGGRGS